jgi:DNA modification methylase
MLTKEMHANTDLTLNIMSENKRPEDFLANINSLNSKLLDYFKNVLEVNGKLDRKLVSFQANKTEPFYRWYKYKEAFSSRLVKYLLEEYKVSKGIVFDPFAGIGTTIFAASEMGYDTEGIELLAVGIKIIESRADAVKNAKKSDVFRLIFWRDHHPWKQSTSYEILNNLRITRGAYSEETEKSIEKYLSEIKNESKNIQEILLTALLCILESISYTRKDGQYLRWDFRSGRRKGKNTFNKGRVYSFEEAIALKLDEIIKDIEGRDKQSSLSEEYKSIHGNTKLYKGSCLTILPQIEDSKYTAIITSPPYCNRYDYTRTYALELALLGVKEEELLSLRQTMLSCTVENREKDLVKINQNWEKVIQTCEKNELLQAIISFLDHKKELKELNNIGIPRMVKGYFYEMACVIHECYRVLSKNGLLFMVNDNVRYVGASISVDLILSEFAEDFGFFVEKILVLPIGKGNSSQQMGNHGRDQLRKCVYVWRKNG